MNSRIKQSLSGTEPRFWIPRFVAVSLLAFGFAGWLIAGEQRAPDLTVHEWGTFTAIAGKDGRAVKWLPLTGSTAAHAAFCNDLLIFPNSSNI